LLVSSRRLRGGPCCHGAQRSPTRRLIVPPNRFPLFACQRPNSGWRLPAPASPGIPRVHEPSIWPDISIRKFTWFLDNLSSHKPKEDRWLRAHPNVRFHFTPTHASWLNQIEIWFSILSRQALRGANFTSVARLRQAIDEFIKNYNSDAAPFELQHLRRRKLLRMEGPSPRGTLESGGANKGNHDEKIQKPRYRIQNTLSSPRCLFSSPCPSVICEILLRIHSLSAANPLEVGMIAVKSSGVNRIEGARLRGGWSLSLSPFLEPGLFHAEIPKPPTPEDE